MNRSAPTRRIVAVLALAIGILGPSAIARAEGPNAVRQLAGCTTNTLPANDDGSTTAVALPFAIDFFDNPYTTLFVNNNGNVTFDEALGDYTPFDFRDSGTPMIAPFLADIDTRGLGNTAVTYGNVTVDGKAAFCVNWVNVGYFNSHTDKLNSAQLLLIQNGPTAGDFDIELNYDKVQWETGGASGGTDGFGGTSAVVGWTNGDGDSAHSSIQPGSFVNGGLLDSNASTGLIHGMDGPGGQFGRYVFQIRNGASGPRLTGHVKSDGGDPAINAPVEICRHDGTIPCKVRNTSQSGDFTASGLTPGLYDLTAHPPSDGDGADGTPAHGQVTMGAVDTAATDLTLGPGPSPPPPGTTITSFDVTDTGLPVAYWGDPLTIQTDACDGATVSYTMDLDGQAGIRSGPMTEGPAGHYSATAAALEPDHGDGIVTIHVDCPGADPDPADIEFGIYIDPSGKVRNESGAPIEGATVTLLRSTDAAGPFLPVPDGSPVMSPSNRTNPDQSRADGRFGWDVVAGYYKVRASKDGCVDNATRTSSFAESGVLTIPPPVTDLDLRLYCPPESTGGTNNGNTGNNGSGGGSGSTQAKIASVGKPSAKGGKVKIKVTCAKTASGTCAGSVTVTTTVKAKKGKPKKSAKAKTVVIGKAKFKSLKAGKSKVVTVTLNKAGKKLAKKGKVKSKVAVKVKDTAGTPTTLTKNVTVPKAKARKKH